MTTTFETAPLKKTAAECTSSVEVAEAVLGRLHELQDSSSEAHRYFYGAPEVVAPELVETKLPSGGHNLLFQNETEHHVTLPTGKATKVETFKWRGARAAVVFAFLENPELGEVTTATAGGHGQGVAAAGLEFGLSCEVHTPKDASTVKIARMEALGANVENRTHDSLVPARQAAEQRAKLNPKLAYIDPFNHVNTIAGAATVGVDMLSNLRRRAATGKLDLHQDPIDVIVPVGGGGLAAGVAIVFKEARDNGVIGNNVRVITAVIQDKETNTLCDGTRTKVGELPALVLSDSNYVQGQVVVSDLEVANGMCDLTGVYNKPIEGAGAIPYAGAQKLNRAYPTRDGYVRTTIVVPVTGANVSPETYAAAMRLRDKAYADNMRALGKFASHTSLDRTVGKSAVLNGPTQRSYMRKARGE